VVEDFSMATTTAVSPDAPESQPQISAFGRVFGALFSPQKTFEDIVRKPGWIVPVVLLTILSIAVSYTLVQRVNWREYISQQMDKSPQAAQLSPAQKEQRLDAAVKFTTPFIWAVGVCGPLLGILFFALVFWGAYSLMGGISTNFSTAFSIAAHAFMTGLVSSPLLILVLFLKDPSAIDPNNPLASNIAAVLPDDSAQWLVALCKSFDLFTFWTLILLAIGFTAVNPKKLKGAKPYTIAFTLWAVYVVLRVGWNFIFS
jgi:Yip1 domain